MSDERDAASQFGGVEPLPPDTALVDRRLRRDGASWQAQVPETLRLDALARTIAATLEMPETERASSSDAPPAAPPPDVSASRLVPIRRRSPAQNLLSAVATLTIITLMGVLFFSLAHRGPAATLQGTVTPLASASAQAARTPTASPAARYRPGTLLWYFATGNIIESTPAVADGVVYLGGADANLYAISARTGDRVWAVHVGATIQGSLIVANGLVYLGGVDGAIYAYRASDGTQVWHVRPPNALFGAASILVAQGVVYAGSANNDASPSSLYALNARTGATLWTYQTNGSIYSAPVIASGVLYTIAQDRSGSGVYTAYAISLASHTQIWQAPVHGFGLTVANNIVYAALGSPDVIALDANTGSQLWDKRLESGSGVGISLPSVVNGVVYVGAGSGTLYALDASTGKTLWSYLTSGEIFSTPAVANGVVYVGSVDGSVYALTSPGKVVWRYPTGGMVETSAVVTSGVVYIGSNDRNLYALVA